MNTPRWAHRLWSRITRGEWHECPVCGRGFGSHENGGELPVFWDNGEPRYTWHPICPNCAETWRVGQRWERGDLRHEDWRAVPALRLGIKYMGSYGLDTRLVAVRRWEPKRTYAIPREAIHRRPPTDADLLIAPDLHGLDPNLRDGQFTAAMIHVYIRRIESALEVLDQPKLAKDCERVREYLHRLIEVLCEGEEA